MCASLSGGPRYLKEMKPSFVTDASANTVGRLCHRMAVKRELIVLFDEYIVRPESRYVVALKTQLHEEVMSMVFPDFNKLTVYGFQRGLY